MTNESPQFSDDESRRIQAEIDRIRSGLKWLKAGQVEPFRSDEAFRSDEPDGPEDDDSDTGETEDLRSLTERMQSIVDRVRIHAERFERLMGQAPEERVATFAEVQQMLAETLAKRKREPGAEAPAKSAPAKRGGGKSPTGKSPTDKSPAKPRARRKSA